MNPGAGASALVVARISAGVVTAIQGFLLLRGKGKGRPNFLERPLMDVLALRVRDPAQLARLLGRVRLTYGLFLVVVGVWGLTL